MGNLIEEFSVDSSTPQPLKFIRRMTMNGNILSLHRINSGKNIAVITDSFDVVVLTNELAFVATKSLKQTFGRVSMTTFLASYNEKHQVLCAHFYQGNLKLIRFYKDNISVTDVRIHERDVLHMCLFNRGTKTLMVALLSRDMNNIVHLKTYSINDKSSGVHDRLSFELTPADLNVRDAKSTFLAQTNAGFYSFESQTIKFYNGNSITDVKSSFADIECVYSDKENFFFGDSNENLYRLNVETFEIDLIGKLETIPSCLVELKDGLIFCGSAYGKSILIKISHQIEVIDFLQNIAPITDMILCDTSDGRHLITCSGGFQQSSLSVIKHGLGVNQLAVVEIENIQKLFTLDDSLILLSFVSHSELLRMSETGELESLNPIQFCDSQSTIYAFSFRGSSIQVVQNEILCLNQSIPSWKPPEGSLITFACSDNDSLLVALSDSTLILMQLSAENGFLPLASHCFNDNREISCLCLDSQLKISGVCFWNSSEILVFDWAMKRQQLFDSKHTVVARSMIFMNKDFLLTAMGDGHVLIFSLSSSMQCKSIDCGSLCPPVLCRMSDNSFFVAGEKSICLTIDNQRIKWDNVNCKKINNVSSFNSQSTGECILVTDDSQMIFMRVNQTQRLHIKSIPIKHQARRICYLKSIDAICALMIESNQNYQLQLFKLNSFICLSNLQLPRNHHGNCIQLVKSDDMEYILIGVGISSADSKTPHGGAILVVQVQANNTMSIVSTLPVKGSVYSIRQLSATTIVCGIDSQLALFQLQSNTFVPLFSSRKSIGSFVSCLYIDSIENQFVVGDIMKSVALCQMDNNDQIKISSRDVGVNWTTAVKLSKEFIISSDTNRNVKIFDKSPQELKTIASIHSGEFINKIIEGSLVQEESPLPSFLFASVSGAIGIILEITKSEFDILDALQREMNKLTFSISGQYQKDSRNWKNFIDGDFVQSFLDWSPDLAQTVVNESGRTKPEIVKLLEEIKNFY